MQSLREENVISEFQRRRKRMLHSFAFCMILFALSLAIVQIADSYPTLFGLGRNGWYAFGIAQFVTGVVFALIGFLQYRCPVCKEIVKGHDRYYFGVAIDPDRCPNCRARLSDHDTNERK